MNRSKKGRNPRARALLRQPLGCVRQPLGCVCYVRFSLPVPSPRNAKVPVKFETAPRGKVAIVRPSCIAFFGTPSAGQEATTASIACTTGSQPVSSSVLPLLLLPPPNIHAICAIGGGRTAPGGRSALGPVTSTRVWPKKYLATLCSPPGNALGALPRWVLIPADANPATSLFSCRAYSVISPMPLQVFGCDGGAAAAAGMASCPVTTAVSTPGKEGAVLGTSPLPPLNPIFSNPPPWLVSLTTNPSRRTVPSRAESACRSTAKPAASQAAGESPSTSSSISHPCCMVYPPRTRRGEGVRSHAFKSWRKWRWCVVGETVRKGLPRLRPRTADGWWVGWLLVWSRSAPLQGREVHLHRYPVYVEVRSTLVWYRSRTR